ncbi:MAG: SUMF1/EgtB/PvdO family nonheme iron enzyme [Proteobacteria bacterium]|nr:SUMF1/EgtB/PvdO family nonheme iron enzyme [Pseudomonadota bacterium]
MQTNHEGLASVHKLGCSMLLGLAIVAIGGCGRAPAPVTAQHKAPVVAPPASPALVTPAELASEPPPAPVQLPHPAIEPLPAITAVPKKKVAAALREARQALNAGRIDERDIDDADVSPASPALPAMANSPTGINALALYRGALATEPKNAAALQGVDTVIAALYARANNDLKHEHVADAQRDADRIGLLRADDAGLPALHEALAKAWTVAGYIERGRRYESVGALIAPRSDNAAAAYRQALKLDANSMGARAGLDRIEGIFIANALSQANSAHYPQAQTTLAEAMHVRGGSPALTEAQASLQAIRLRHAQLLKVQAEAALDAGDIARAAGLQLRIEYAMPHSAIARQMREDIENARLYGRHRPGQVFNDPLRSGGRTPDMVVIPVGRFMMGSANDEAGHDGNESPQRQIVFRHGFAMARTEITVGQFARFVRATGYKTDAERSGHSMVFDERQGKLVSRDDVSWRDDHLGNKAADDLPAIHVSWNDAQAYAIWLSSQSAHLYRLPNEAEYEYALRAGTSSAFPWPGKTPPRDVGNLAGSDPSPTGRRWGDAFAGYSDGYWGTAPVAKFTANAFGLYDMVGNVSEWVQDCWHDSYRRAPEDASAWVNPGCTQRVVRGASWASAPSHARSAWRTWVKVDDSNSQLGFRVVRDL